MQEGWPNTATSWVEVQYPPEAKEAAASSRLGVCVKPLYGGYNRALGLIEFISMYQLLGATDFVFYNHSVGAEVTGRAVNVRQNAIFGEVAYSFFFLLKAPSPSSAFTLKKLLHCKWEFKYDLSRMQDIAKVTAVDTMTKSRGAVVLMI